MISIADIETGPVNADVAISLERFDPLLEQAHISNLFASQTSCLPWWLGVHAAIFSDTWDTVQCQELNVVVAPELPSVEKQEDKNAVAFAVAD